MAAIQSEAWMPVKVLLGQKMKPNEKALNDFYNDWATRRKKIPFTGEYNVPISNDVRRLAFVNPANVSHCVTDIDMSTYDKKKATVMMKIRFTGPKGDEAFDECLNNNIRFVTRGININGEDHIVTFDLVHAPAYARKKSIIKQQSIQV